MSPELQTRRQAVETALRRAGRVIVAFSGGVDSTLLAKMAVDVLGAERVLAVTADSPSLAREDLAAARRLARELGLTHRIIQTQELSDERYRENRGDRCYVCKQTLFEDIRALARDEGYDAVLYGAIGSDVAADRPGQRAAAEQRVQAPLQDAGLTKRQVRELARDLGLPNWDRPQNACLASRIPPGEAVTPEKLLLVERAESAVRRLGFRQVRVRYAGEAATVEVGQDELPRLADQGLRQQVLEAVRASGFADAEISPLGYHTLA